MFKRIIILIIGLCLLTGCGGTAEEPLPEQALFQFVAAWNEGDYEGMYHLLCRSSQDEISRDDFMARYGNISKGMGLKAVVLETYSVESMEGQAELDYTLRFETATVPEFTQQYRMVMAKSEEHWQIVWGNHLVFPTLKAGQIVRVQRSFPQRGRLTDRRLGALAQTGTMMEVGVDPGKIENEYALTAGLSVLLQLGEERIQRQLGQAWAKPGYFVPMKMITQREWEQKKDALLALPGVMARRREGRMYHHTAAMAQTIGYMSEINPERLEQLRPLGYRSGDMVGAAGLEAAFEEILTGRIGFAITIHEPGGDAVETVAVVEKADGDDVVLTLDRELSLIAEAALGRMSGSVVLMNHQTGELLALVSKPGFDSNLFVQGITTEQYRNLEAMDSPFLNRPLSGLYPPGSVFKPFTALMALQENVLDPSASWDTPKQWQPSAGWGGYRVTRVERPQGPVDLLKGMKWSDNVYFADLSLKVGWEAFDFYANRLGFAESIPLQLPARSSSLLRNDRRDTLLADSGYGQGEMQVTPLHMTLMAAALARGDGAIPQPRLKTGEPPQVWLQTGFSPEHIKTVDEVLRASVQDRDALAYLGETGKDIRGKTGTSQLAGGRHAAWFICYFDSYVLTVVLEGDTETTSRQAMQAAKLILDYGFPATEGN
jgi:penicillin-binding protein 3